MILVEIVLLVEKILSEDFSIFCSTLTSGRINYHKELESFNIISKIVKTEILF